MADAVGEAERCFLLSLRLELSHTSSILSDVCSVIVHLHLNRYPYPLILPHPKQPVAR